MNYRQLAALLFSLFLFLFFAGLVILFKSKERRKQAMRNIAYGYASIDAGSQNAASTLSSGILKGYAQNLQSMLNEIYEGNATPQSLMKKQIMILLFGLSFTLISHLVFKVLIVTLIIFFTTLILAFMPYSSLKSSVNGKRAAFDDALNAFETNMLLGLESNATPIKSMEMAVRTLPEGLVRIEFQQLLRDIQLDSDNIAKPYMKLAQRVPTKDCERFCNIIISGVKNGNSMRDILSQESEHMSQQQLNKIQEQGQKNSIKATAISSGLIFLPLIIIFIAPLMANSM